MGDCSWLPLAADSAAAAGWWGVAAALAAILAAGLLARRRGWEGSSSVPGPRAPFWPPRVPTAARDTGPSHAPATMRCVSCGSNKAADCFANSQRKKPAGGRRCSACAVIEDQEQPPPPPAGEHDEPGSAPQPPQPQLDLFQQQQPLPQQQATSHPAPAAVAGGAAGGSNDAAGDGGQEPRAAAAAANVEAGAAGTATAALPLADGGAPRMGSGDVPAVCMLCLDGDELPFPVQCGCACRGDAGLAHAHCKIEHARYLLENGGIPESSGPEIEWTKPWSVCATCGQNYTGAMALALAKDLNSTRSKNPAAHTTAAVPGRGNGGGRDKDWVIAQNVLAGSLLGAGRLSESIELMREIAATCFQIYGPAGDNTLLIADNLGNALKEAGEHAEAEAILRKGLWTRRRLLRQAHRDDLEAEMANGMTLLAGVLFAQHHCDEAAQLHRSAATILARVHGPEHHSTLTARGNLAQTLVREQRDRGRGASVADAPGCVEAEAILRQVLRTRTRVLGPHHPSTLKTSTDMAELLRVTGKYADAAEQYRKAVAALERVFGRNHPRTTAAQQDLIRATRDGTRCAA